MFQKDCWLALSWDGGRERKSTSAQNLGLGSVLGWVLVQGLGLASVVGSADDVVSGVVLKCGVQWSWVQFCSASWKWVLGSILDRVNRELPEQDIQLVLVCVFAGSCGGLWKVLK